MVGENIIRCLPRANCGIFFKGWAQGKTEADSTVTSPVTTLTSNASEYFCTPDRRGDWYNVKMFVINDRS